MPDVDAEMMLDQVVMLGLVSREQLREAQAEGGDGSPDSSIRMLLRKGALTSWQIDRLKKGDPSGFFYGDSKVLFHLAEGTFARVYRAEHSTTKAALAVKVLRQRFASISEAVHRFHQEAEAGIRLRHPNIVQIIDVGQQDHRHFMIMEYVEGMNLRDFMKLRPRMMAQQALPLMLGMSRGLQYSLERGVTHRDLKGTNILISNSGEAKLVDFGLATMHSDETKPGVKSLRTVDYSALERTCKSPKGDPRSDIYFLGCVFYQMVTGQLPLPESESQNMLAKMLKRSFGAITPIGDHRYAPEEELALIIEKMMKIDLKARYQNMEDVVADLDRFHSHMKGAIAESAAEPEGDFSEVESFFAPAAAGHAAVAGASEPLQPFETKAVVAKNVLCVEAQSEIQDALRKSLAGWGYRPLLVSDAETAAERFRESPVDAVIFDTDGQGAESIDAFIDMHETAHSEGQQLRAIVLLGPRQGALKEKLPDDGQLIVLSKPLKMKQVQDALAELLPPV